MEKNMQRSMGENPKDIYKKIPETFRADRRTPRGEPQPVTWAETFKTLGCGMLVVLVVLGTIAGCVGLFWISRTGGAWR
jgi:hypothetical protein